MSYNREISTIYFTSTQKPALGFAQNVNNIMSYGTRQYDSINAELLKIAKQSRGWTLLSLQITAALSLSPGYVIHKVQHTTAEDISSEST